MTLACVMPNGKTILKIFWLGFFFVLFFFFKYKFILGWCVRSVPIVGSKITTPVGRNPLILDSYNQSKVWRSHPAFAFRFGAF